MGTSIQAAAQDTYEQTVRRGVTALEDDSLSTAEHLFRQALHAEPSAPGNALVWGYLAAIYERTNREHQALEAYNIAVGLSPRTLGLLLGRASLYMKLGNESRALADYNDVLDLREDHPEALLMRAYIKRRQRLLKEARTDYEHLLRLDPVHEQALLGLALLNDEDRRPAEAMETINRVIGLYPTHAAGYALRAGMEMDRHQYEHAEADYAEAIRLAPEDPAYLLARARLYTLTKQKKLARQDARRATQLGASKEEIAGALNLQVQSN
ncbi:MAG: tetratricopeptide repeat protein [Bacteroidales bacterium]|nr:tetratricopeptide repeat protein [Bacteroidales bacterium]